MNSGLADSGGVKIVVTRKIHPPSGSILKKRRDTHVGDPSNLYGWRFRASLLGVYAAEGAVVKRCLVHCWAHFRTGLDSL